MYMIQKRQQHQRVAYAVVQYIMLKTVCTYIIDSWRVHYLYTDTIIEPYQQLQYIVVSKQESLTAYTEPLLLIPSAHKINDQH